VLAARSIIASVIILAGVALLTIAPPGRRKPAEAAVPSRRWRLRAKTGRKTASSREGDVR
jgi:hypothetical protein